MKRNFIFVCLLLVFTLEGYTQAHSSKKMALVTLNSPFPESFSSEVTNVPKENRKIDNIKNQLNEFRNIGYDINLIKKEKSRKIEKLCEEAELNEVDELGILKYNNNLTVAEYTKNEHMFGNESIDYKDGIKILAAYLINHIERIKNDTTLTNLSLGNEHVFLICLYDQISADQTIPGVKYYRNNTNLKAIVLQIG